MIHSKPISVILDIGSSRTYAGIAGEENPRLATHSYLTTDTGFKGDDNFAKYSVGQNDIKLGRPNDQIESVYKQVNQFGQISSYEFNKNNIEMFLEIMLGKTLGLEGSNISILLTEDPVAQRHQLQKQRQNICEFLFQALEIEALTFIKKPVLSCFGLGKSSGLVVDSGHSFTRASVVEDGYCVYSQHVNYGGAIINGIVSEHLNSKNKGWGLGIENSECQKGFISFHRMREIEKIKHLFKSMIGSEESEMEEEGEEISYTLPDGNSVVLNRAQIMDPFTRFSEFYNKYLNDPQIEERVQKDEKGIKMAPFITERCFINPVWYRSPANLALDTINQYSFHLESHSKSTVFPNQHKTHTHSSNLIKTNLLNSIILTGGNFLFHDISKKTKEELKSRSNEKIKTYVSPIYDEGLNDNSTSWIGGSIIADMPSFNYFWVSRKEWNEQKNIPIPDPLKSHPATQAQAQRGKNLQGMSLVNKKCP